jgi:hypothetical protein
MSIIQALFATGASPLAVEVLMMAGGGGAKSDIASVIDDDFIGPVVGGGGGAGGLYIYSETLNSGISRTVTIGGGGTGNVNGSNTTFTGAPDAIGGGGGSSPVQTSKNGGSGGGGQGNTGFVVAGGLGTSGQGNNGGSGYAQRGFPPTGAGGGGGGKGGVGANGESAVGGVGGTGYDLATFRGGSSLVVAFGGGGVGGSGVGPGGGGASSIGNNGDGTTTNTQPANTGGGARGDNTWVTSYSGGSGRVLVRYPGTTTKATGGNITTANVSGTDYVIHDFTAGGTFTVNA